jgi:hypothetical protein
MQSLDVYMVYLILVNLEISTVGAIIGALLFLLHPLQVEAVAWISGFRDLLGNFIAFSCILLWMRGSNKISIRLLVMVLMGLSLLAKPSTAILPGFLIAYSFIQEEKFNPLSFIIKYWPLGVGLLAGAWAAQSTKSFQESYMQDIIRVEWYQQILIVLDSWGFYLSKLFLPISLMPDYGRIPSVVINEHWYMITSALALGSIAIFLYFRKKIEFRAQVALLICFLFYFPTSGVVNFAYQNISTTADRYFFAPMVGVAILIGLWHDKLTPKMARIFQIAAAIVLCVYAFLSYEQIGIWRNNRSFYSRMLEGAPNSYPAHLNLGSVFMSSDLKESEIHFKRAHDVRPTEIGPIAGLASVYLMAQNYAALDILAQQYLNNEQLSKMYLVQSHISTLYEVYGTSLVQRNRAEESFTFLCTAAQLNPISTPRLKVMIQQLGKTFGPALSQNPYCKNFL